MECAFVQTFQGGCIMSNSVFQSVIVQLKDISDRTFGVIDSEGRVVSCTNVTLLGEHWVDAARHREYPQ